MPNKHKKQKVQTQESKQQMEHKPEHSDDVLLELPPPEIQVPQVSQQSDSPTIQQIFMSKMQIRDAEITFNELQDIFYIPPSKI